MSFLKPMGGAAGAMPQANAAATGLGHLFGADPSRISEIAGRIGKGMNAVATAGGATPGYQAEAAPVDNHLQLLDPAMLQRIIQQFGGRPQGYAQ